LFVIIVIHAYFIHISQGSVETYLRFGGIYNNHVIANWMQSVTVKKFWKSVNNWQRYGQKWSATFLWPTVYKVTWWQNGLTIERSGVSDYNNDETGKHSAWSESKDP